MAAAARAAHVEVDCRRWDGVLRRIWTSFGYDELNFTATPRGKQNLATLRAFMEVPYTVRAHNLYTSGTGRVLPHWSSGNVYHEDAAGRPHYDWTLVDPVFDAWVHKGVPAHRRAGLLPQGVGPGVGHAPVHVHAVGLQRL